jgi:hypothetical protein
MFAECAGRGHATLALASRLFFYTANREETGAPKVGAPKGRSLMPHRLRQMLILSFALTFGLASAAGTVLAQDEEIAGFPVTIHEGNCDTPDANPLHDLGVAMPRAQMEDAEMRGSADVPVYEVDENVGGTFGDLTDSPHVILIHESEANFGTAVACGVIGGADVDGRIIVPVRPLESQVVGFAILNEDDAGFLGLGDDEVNTTVYLYEETLLEAADAASTPTPLPDQPAPAEPATPEPTPTPEETPTPEATETPEQEVIELPTEATLEYSDDGLNLSEFTVPANLDYTLNLSNLTENDVEFTIEALDITETMPAGEVQSITINVEEGEYEYQVNGETGTMTALPQADNQG